MSEQITIRVLNPPKVKVTAVSTAGVTVRIGGRVIQASEVNLVENETPSGAVDGSNATYVSEFDFIPASVEVFVNGLKQKPIVHFITTGIKTIILSDSPQSGDQILINYQKA